MAKKEQGVISASAIDKKNKEAFWFGHIEAKQQSKLTRIKYCKIHRLSPFQFDYWAKKYNQQSEREVKQATLVSVQLQTPSTCIEKKFCTLNLKSGHSIEIHDKQALLYILERFN